MGDIDAAAAGRHFRVRRTSRCVFVAAAAPHRRCRRASRGGGAWRAPTGRPARRVGAADQSQRRAVWAKRAKGCAIRAMPLFPSCTAYSGQEGGGSGLVGLGRGGSVEGRVADCRQKQTKRRMGAGSYLRVAAPPAGPPLPMRRSAMLDSKWDVGLPHCGQHAAAPSCPAPE